MRRHLKKKRQLFTIFLLFLSGFLGQPGWSGTEDSAFLFLPFEGFSEEGMAPLLKLMRADSQGRQLLRKTLSRAKLKNAKQLVEILSYCEGTDLSGPWERRGLFTQETAYFYRTKGEKAWQDGGSGELAKLSDPKQYPVLAEKQYQTENFEHLEVAFRPQICLRPGMSILQTYLVLFHELIHLTGIKHFKQLDLFSFADHNKQDRYYYQQLAKSGGELEAYLAQLQAFKRLKRKYDIPEKWVLEGFLDPKGRLDYRDRDAFMDHLLDRAGYKQQLDQYLDQQILLQYNRAYAWWEYLERLISLYDENAQIIDGNLKKINEQVSQWKKANQSVPESLVQSKKKWRQARTETRRKRKAYRTEQLVLERLMEKVDRHHPRE